MNVADQRGFYFIDTNIIVYTFDTTAPEKREVAQALLHHALQTQQGVISSQVVQEFLNVALRKFSTPMTMVEAREYLRLVLMPLCRHFPSLTFYESALKFQSETEFFFYDSLIVTAAIETKCDTLVTEDLQHGRVVQGVTIQNPFAV